MRFLPSFVPWLTAVSAHMCILEPPQRGPLDVTTPGDPSCYRRTSYCGGVPAPDPLVTTTLVAGGKTVMKFQQNLNHWHPSKTGWMDISLAYSTNPTEADFVPLTYLMDFPGMDMVQSTMYNLEVTLPKEPCSHCILRVQYVSYNPGEVDPKNNTNVSK